MATKNKAEIEIREWLARRDEFRKTQVHRITDDERIARVLLAEIDRLRTALRPYVEWHGPTAEHHREDCEDSDTCEPCKIDAAVSEVLR